MSKKQKKPSPKEEAAGWRTEIYEWLGLLTGVLAFITLFFTFFGIVFSVSGNSMYPTLHHADAMFVQRIGYTPKQGDIVIIRKDGFPADETAAIVKRVIATAGQEVYIDYDENTVYVDGVELPEDYLNFGNELPHEDTHLRDWFGDDYMADIFASDNASFIVEENSVFVMGDNRNGSDDSRDYDLGSVDTRYVVGRALCVFFPLDRIKVL